MVFLKFLQIQEDKFGLTNLFEVLITLITLVLPRRILLIKRFYHF